MQPGTQGARRGVRGSLAWSLAAFCATQGPGECARPLACTVGVSVMGDLLARLLPPKARSNMNVSLVLQLTTCCRPSICEQAVALSRVPLAHTGSVYSAPCCAAVAHTHLSVRVEAAIVACCLDACGCTHAQQASTCVLARHSEVQVLCGQRTAVAGCGAPVPGRPRGSVFPRAAWQTCSTAWRTAQPRLTARLTCGSRASSTLG